MGVNISMIISTLQKWQKLFCGFPLYCSSTCILLLVKYAKNLLLQRATKIRNMRAYGMKLERSKLPVEHSSNETQSAQLQHLHHMSPYLEMVILNTQVENIPQMVLSITHQVSLKHKMKIGMDISDNNCT